MKKILPGIIFFLACTISMHAQTLYGTTFNGGDYNGGTINKFIPATNNLTVAKSFQSIAYFPEYTNFIQASDGKLYGMTYHGGNYGSGVIFSYDPSTSIYSRLKDFDFTNGGNPSGSLFQAIDGKLYGTTTRGGSSGYGVIFSFDLISSTYTKVKDFDSTDGSLPTGNLIQTSDGKLYGMTSSGGTSNNGVIFSFVPSTSAYTKLMDFDGPNGALPLGSFIQATDGKFYGMTYGGGSSARGVIFSFDPVASTYIKLKDFDATNGGFPFGNLIQASNGKLYGMTFIGGSSTSGVIFSFDPLSSTYVQLKDFDNVNGAYPVGNLIQLSNGKLYGTTDFGGSNAGGVIFSFDPSSSIYTKLKDFDITNGANPHGSLLKAGDGKLYALTYEGGGNNSGVIFSFDPVTSTYTKLKDLASNETGSNISASLIQAGDGKLYGMTSRGGASALGVIFSFDPSASTYTKLKDFDGITGRNPSGSFIYASNGKLYGMTPYGGSSDLGVIYSYDPLTSTYTKLKDFNNSDGAKPFGSFVQAGDGKLYGMTSVGGSGNAGVIFSYDLSTSTYTKLYDFNFATGGSPNGSLIQASDGKLYGIASTGGFYNSGAIFSFDLLSSTYTNLRDFNNFNGAPSLGSFIQALDGKLYSMVTGGNNNFGLIFSYDLSGPTYTKLVDFDNINGASPLGNLMQASDGKLYGMTNAGGITDSGVIFSYDPIGSTYTKLKDFDGTNGANPDRGAAFIEIKECITGKTYYQDADSDGYGNPDSSVTACTQPAGYVTDNKDCNDNNKVIHAPVTYYRDADRDGFGDAYTSISVCKASPPRGYVKNNYDCNDHKRAGRIWNERVRMCHNGREECVPVKDIFIRLWHGWTLGPCPASCDTSLSKTIPAEIENELMYSKHESLPREYKLSSYPNPFAGTSTIKYELPLDSRVSIKVYDVLGRAVATLVDEYKKAGTYTVNFKAGRLGSGTLYYRIIAHSKEGQFDQTNKMIQLR